MLIFREETPNPNSLKFVLGVEINSGKPANFISKTACTNSPLAARLFELEHVDGVFFGSNFATVSKLDEGDWDLIEPNVMLILDEHLTSGEPAIVISCESDEDGLISCSAGSATGSSANQKGGDSDIASRIKAILEKYITPFVQEDGGDIIFHSFDPETGIVHLELHGACSGCPSAAVTLKQGVETILKQHVPEVQSVEQVSMRPSCGGW